MTKVVGYSSEEDFRRAANAIRYIERGGIDHPYYRRQSPIAEESDCCCDDTVLIVSNYYTVASGQHAPPRFQITFPDMEAFDGSTRTVNLWFGARNSANNAVYISDSIPFDVSGSPRNYHFYIAQPGPTATMTLVDDTTTNSASLALIYGFLDRADMMVSSQMQLQNRNLSPSNDITRALPKRLCLTPVDTDWTQRPLETLYGGVPPSTLHVDLTPAVGSPSSFTLTRYTGTNTDVYSESSVQRGCLYCAFDDDGQVDMGNIRFAAGLGADQVMSQPFSGSLDLTFTKPNGDSYHVYP